MNKKSIGIVGSTGSIGTQSVEVILKNRELFDVNFLLCHSNINEILKQIKLLKPKYAIVLSGNISEDKIGETKIFSKNEDLLNIIRNEKLDLLLSAVVGFAGIIPTLEGIKMGIDIALANKESIVAGGKILLNIAKKTKSQIIPVDSEHSAIFQSLMGQDKSKLCGITLTASGGPFIKRPEDSLTYVSVEETLKHPNWNMGSKITVDSSTMMNKGLELIEARYLFDVEATLLNVVVHPQSVIHSYVSFIDGSIIAQLGFPDMRVPISFALGFPERISSGVKPIDLTKISTLNFYEPDLKKYRCLKVAIDVLHTDSNLLMTVLNAANEVAVELFLKKQIRFTDIPFLVEKTVSRFSDKDIFDIEEIFETDILAREMAKKIYNMELKD